MDRWRDRVVLVTGASAGFGAAICKLLAGHGMKVVGCARRVEKIEDMTKEHPNIRGYKCDLRNDKEVEDMFQWIKDEPGLGRIDVCVANAGISPDKSLLEGTVEEWKSMTDVNVIALCLCAQLSMKSMLANGIDDGQIIFLNSLCGHRVPPGLPAARFYSATKFMVTALTEGWRQEARDQGDNNIRVAAISPGLAATEFHSTMFRGDEKKVADLYSGVGCVLRAEDIADHVKFVLEAPKHVQINDILVRPTQQKK